MEPILERINRNDDRLTGWWSDGQITTMSLRNYPGDLNLESLKRILKENRFPTAFSGEASFVNTSKYPPFIEFRPSVNRHFVVIPELGLELAPAFELLPTAKEVAYHSFWGTPFFDRIPTVKYRTPYPRPNRMHAHPPKVEFSAFEVVTRDYGD